VTQVITHLVLDQPDKLSLPSRLCISAIPVLTVQGGSVSCFVQRTFGALNLLIKTIRLGSLKLTFIEVEFA